MSESRLPDLSKLSVPQLLQGLDMGAGALAVHDSLLDLLVNDESLTVEDVKVILAGEMLRISSDLQAIELEISLKLQSN